MKTKTITFESALQKLEETVDKLEEGSIPLDEALTTFESGVRWSRECSKFLENAEQRIETIIKNENGEYEQKEFLLE
ncbi:MAG TPA: exodeoxyribonuclease VII small subunit [Candidatus Lambdaproteobacteria bacterium]|jgi:exodeoxyribonuclease VII small subunit|nr:exodeoxyribonuclease VII small subunit [SAR324 cluster bacterium]HIB92859.1 exodeoxyribonuclease VII small subunit [Candidatus Lambdaproteobacteria bacterium]HIO10362.1 exodeoxyribonuclease VII small subunit [Deltaproteobacteria bacterium]